MGLGAVSSSSASSTISVSRTVGSTTVGVRAVFFGVCGGLLGVRGGLFGVRGGLLRFEFCGWNPDIIVGVLGGMEGVRWRVGGWERAAGRGVNISGSTLSR